MPKTFSAEEINEHIGRRIRQRRRTLGLSQTKVGKQLGVSYQLLQKYETGHGRIPADRLYLLSHALMTPVGYFFEEISAPAPKPPSRAVLRIVEHVAALPPSLQRVVARFIKELAGIRS